MKSQAYPRVFVVAAFLVALVAGVYTVLLVYRPVIEPVLDVAPPFVIGIVLALLLDPLLDRIEKKGLSRGMGVAIVGLSFLIVFLLVGFLLVPKVAEQASQLAAGFPQYVSDAQTQLDKLLRDHRPMLNRFHLPTSASAWTAKFSAQLQEAGSASVNLLAVGLTAALSKILWVIIIPLSTLWLLRDLDYIRQKIVHFTPEKHRYRLISMTSAVGGVFEKYVRGMILVAILYSGVAMFVLTAAGLQYGLIIGAIAGLLYLVPYVGVITLVLVTGVAGVAQPMSMTVVGVLMGALLVQSFIVFDMIVTPRIVGGSVGVHPVLALFSLALGARMFGVLGMILAVPVAASVQVALGQLYPVITERVSKPPYVPKPAHEEEPL